MIASVKETTNKLPTLKLPVNYTIWESDFPFSKEDKEEYAAMYRETHGLYPNEFVDNKEIYHYAFQVNEDILDDIMSNIIFHENKHGGKLYVVLGEFSFWNGCKKGGEICCGMADVINRCFEDFNWIGYKNNLLQIKATHHDGTNKFKIRELTLEGEEYFKKNKSIKDTRFLHSRLFKDSHLSHTVSIFKEIF